TGVSGSGKSSLAFDTIYAEGQRRYVESLSAYARQFLGQMEKPRVDFIGGLSPAIAIEQKTVSKNPRSTVGTVTEVMDYLRVLFARIGHARCPKCGRAVEAQSAQQIADRLAALPAGTRLQLLAPVVRRRKGTHAEVLEQARRGGYVRARIDSAPVDLSGEIALAKTKPHSIELIIDRLRVPEDEDDATARAEFVSRLVDSVETTLRAGDGILIADVGTGEDVVLSEHNACAHCGISFPALSPQLFSFNSPLGMCPDCHGLGTQMTVDVARILHDPALSLLDGALRWYGEMRKKKESWTLRQVQAIAAHYHVSLETPWRELPQTFRDALLYGSGDERVRFTYASESEHSSWSGESVRPVRGIVANVERLFRQTTSEQTRRWYASFMSEQPCPTCAGERLRAEARAVTVGGTTLPALGRLSIAQALEWVHGLYSAAQPVEGAAALLTREELEIAGEVLKEIRERLQFMLNVGLHYLTLDRPAPTLSGGEGQRIRLASQLGCGLVGVLYILDEPSIGLHARDNRALIETLARLRDMGNTVLVVEHDAETMHASDWIVDLGPGAGILGGAIVAEGTPRAVAANPRSLTGRYLSGALRVTAGAERDRDDAPSEWLTLEGATLHNLKDVTARFPLGRLTCVTGVSGSGKSSLISGTLQPALARAYHKAQATPGPYQRIGGMDLLDKIIDITQDPIGRTPRSNPATYTNVFDEIRRVFAATPDARAHGYRADRFSFNVKGGRCEECKGHGQKRIEMHFLADVWVTCRACKGRRFNRETLAIHYKGKDIAQVLDMDVQEAAEFFAPVPRIARVLRTLADVGLEYLKLGQSATTLSGGEAQRVKLAKELSLVATGRTLYILDEPTTGLHFADIQRLLDVLHRLVAAGNTVIVIEHNLDVIKTADWIVDLGPEGGAGGGGIVVEGTPDEVASHHGSYTGQCLRAVLAAEAPRADAVNA
ncbi:MAG TPA: excinuclease ABC subunit UvrA, partial [Ktedonobacterales bacterium]|nr:excinuclease ABC subunit UvrA [Ktedonobacterales bacterium]